MNILVAHENTAYFHSCTADPWATWRRSAKEPKNVLEAFSRLRCQDLASRRLRVVCYARALHCRGGRLVRIWPLTGEWANGAGWKASNWGCAMSLCLKKTALHVCVRFAWLCGCCVGVCHEEVYVGVELGAGKAPRVCV